MLHFRIVNLILYGGGENVIMKTIITYSGSDSTWHHPHFSIYQETRFSRINITSIRKIKAGPDPLLHARGDRQTVVGVEWREAT